MLVTRERPLSVGAGVGIDVDVDVDADGGVVRPVTDEVCVWVFLRFGMTVPDAKEEADGDLSDWLLRRLGMDAGSLTLR